MPLPIIQRVLPLEAQSLMAELGLMDSKGWAPLPIRAGHNEWEPKEFVAWFEAARWFTDEEVLDQLKPRWGEYDGVIQMVPGNESSLDQRRVMLFSFEGHYIALIVPFETNPDLDAKVLWMWRPQDLTIPVVDPHLSPVGECKVVEAFWPLFLFLLNRLQGFPDLDTKSFSQLGRRVVYQYAKEELNQAIPSSGHTPSGRRI